MTLTDIIGTTKIANTISDKLQTEICNIHLQGDEGRGKTFVAESIGKQLSSKEIAFIFLTGDQSRKEEDFYPLKMFVERKDKTLNKSIKILKETVAGIRIVGKGLQALLDEIDIKKHKAKSIENILPFKSHIEFSLHLIGLHKNYKKTIIVCDDFDFFDRNTIEFLTSLNEGFLALDRSFNISFLIISTSTLSIFPRIGKNYEFTLPPFNLSQIRLIVKLWSGVSLSLEQLEMVKSSSGGHLQLLKILSSHIKVSQDIKGIGKSPDFMVSIIDSRLKRLKDQYANIKNLLVAVFQSGKSSSTYELLCLLGEESNIQETLKSAVQMNLLSIKDGYIHFTHPVIEDYVKVFQYSSKTSFYKKLGQCLHKLSPSDYLRRAVVEELNLNPDQVDILWTLHYIKGMRQGIQNESTYKKKISSSSLGLNLQNAIKHFEACYELALSGSLDDTLIALEEIPDALPREIVCEKYFLKCETLAKKIAKIPKEEALEIIKAWEGIRDIEPEIWYRLMQLKILCAAELGQTSIAREAEGQIVNYFSSRITFDTGAASTLDRLNIFSEILYTPEIAHKKLLLVEQKLSADIENEHFHKIVDLYIARTNLSANSLVLNENEKSIYFAQSAIALMNEYNELRFPYDEVPLSNLCLAMISKDSRTLPGVIERYEQIYKSSKIEENKMLIDMNYAGLLVLNDRYDEARYILENSMYIPEPGIDDSFYSYYYWCNLCLILFLLGETSQAQQHLKKIKDIVGDVAPILAKYYHKHYELLEEVVGNSNIRSHKEIIAYFERRLPIFSSKIWNRFKYGYLLTDIQIWTTS